MYLSYNGVNFQLLRISDFVQTMVYTEDETNYLYTSTDIRCQCILNKSLNNVGGGPNAPPQALNTLLQRLVQPRKPLSIVADSPGGLVPILVSPLPGMTTDFRFGPKCTVMGIDPFHGSGSIWVDLQFHTDVGCTTQCYLLANRFQWTVEHNPDTFAAVHRIEGMANFRVDLMLKNKVTPDELRTQFITPPPTKNFRREPPTITIHPGGDAVSYSIVDTEQMLNGPGLMMFGATNIEIELNREYHSGTMLPEDFIFGANGFQRGVEKAWDHHGWKKLLDRARGIF